MEFLLSSEEDFALAPRDPELAPQQGGSDDLGD
jgi:hypothetical protein